MIRNILNIRPPRKVTVFLFYHIVPGILIKLLKLNLKKTFVIIFDLFLSAVRGVKGRPILWRGQIEIICFFVNSDCRFRLLAKKYKCKVVFIFLYFNVNIVKIKKNVKICKQKNIELEICSFI